MWPWPTWMRSVKNGSAIDEHARHNTTSVYTAAEIFPMLPEKLSTDLTSLNLDEERLAVVVEMIVAPDGSVQGSDIYRARVRNHAKLAYNSVAAWLDGNGTRARGDRGRRGLDENLRLQDRVAQSMKNLRHVHGALELWKPSRRNRSSTATSSVISKWKSEEPRQGHHRGFHDRGQRRDRPVSLVEELPFDPPGGPHPETLGPDRRDRRRNTGSELPDDPDSKALEEFLVTEKAADPLRFPDLSLAVIKLLGAGEYVAELPGDAAPGHFGLAVKDYAHSTAPNRRYPDLITQRLLKAALAGRACALQR